MAMDEALTERKLTILKAIIQNYLETGEPVGSRTLSKYTDLKLSSATIRNEMADLEDLGYIFQPHTSAGRIPSDKGYRFYVDLLMEKKEQEISEREDALLEKTDKVEKVLQQAAKVLASNTNYATMVSTPVNSRNTLKFIQLSQVDEEQIVAVIVLGGNVIKNKIIEVGETLSNENLLKLNMLLNTTLNGLSIDQITLGLIARLKEQAGIHSEVIGHVLDAVAEIIHVDNDMEIYTSGATNIFKYPELSDKQSAQEIISAFEEKQQLADLVTETLASEENHGIQVYIGDEAPVKTMKDCSVVTATFELGEGMKGTIGIIGPKRMDYEHVMKTLKTLQSELDAIYNKEPKGEKGRKLVTENMSKEDMVKEAVEEAKAKAEAEETNATTAEAEEAAEAEAKEDAEDTAEAGEETGSEEDQGEEKSGEKKKFFGKKNKKDKKDEKIEELNDRITRQMAEFDNFRKRSEKEKSQMYEIGAKDIIEKILPVVDNFERGLDSIPEEEKGSPFAEGMEKIYKQLMTTLDSLGVKPIKAVGQEFNPDFHNAVMHVEDEEFGENVVAEEFQKGYMYRESVVRHSMVKVAN